SARGRATRRPTTATATTASGISQCARPSIGRRSRRSARPTGARAPRAFRSPRTLRAPGPSAESYDCAVSRRRALVLAMIAVTVTATTGVATADVSPDQLALMPLPKEAYGNQAMSFELDRGESGVVDNARSAADTSDPSDTGKTVAAAGRVTGFTVSYD